MIRICIVLFILSNLNLFAQETQVDELKEEINALKEAVKILMDKNRESEKKINNLEKRLEETESQSIDSYTDTPASRAKKYLEQDIEMTIANEEFVLEEDEEDNWEADLGILADLTSETTEGAMVIGGFFTLEYTDADSSDSSLRPLFPSESTFNQSHINLYFDFRFYDNFRFFTELRFLYQPANTFLELAQRENSGEVVIERAWAEWEYADWFRVRGGSFFVPYGIWNLEHGDPILVSTFTPVLVRRELFPDRVTGIQIYGTVPIEDYDLLYYAWVANGKGANLAIQDDQNSKAVGGRVELQFPFQGLLSEVAIGVSAYYGKVAGAGADEADFEDTITGIFIDEGNAALLQELVLSGLDPTGDPLAEYVDQAIGFDARFRFENFFVQAEFAFNFVDAKEDPTVDVGGNTINVRAAESFREYGGYVQVAYEKDLRDFGLMGLLTPFFRYGFYENNNNVDGELGSLDIFTAGLNWKANPHLVFKLEYSDIKFPVVNSRDFGIFISSVTVGF